MNGRHFSGRNLAGILGAALMMLATVVGQCQTISQSGEFVTANLGGSQTIWYQTTHSLPYPLAPPTGMVTQINLEYYHLMLGGGSTAPKFYLLRQRSYPGPSSGTYNHTINYDITFDLPYQDYYLWGAYAIVYRFPIDSVIFWQPNNSSNDWWVSDWYSRML
jgi:hypothetical protein